MTTTARDTFVHLFAGGMGGTVGAIITCPLEVVKTRLQSSHSGFDAPVHLRLPEHTNAPYSRLAEHSSAAYHRRHRLERGLGQVAAATAQDRPPPFQRHTGVAQCIRIIVEKEGVRALWKGIGPNLVGVAPSRAIYFGAYQNAKTFFNRHFTPESPSVHTASAMCAGFFSSTVTNPLWFIKTRLQLDQHRFGSHLRVKDCIRRAYAEQGIRGFYRGITASYYGVTETVIHFVIYEHIKRRLQLMRHPDSSEKTSWDFLEFMLAGAFSKTVASVVAYPHEVARTRLREEGTRYRHFFQTLHLVWLEEGWRGLYRGLWTQLLRQIPNTAIMMATYEACVYLLRAPLPEDELYMQTSGEAGANVAE